jgi:hypothetical protein
MFSCPVFVSRGALLSLLALAGGLLAGCGRPESAALVAPSPEVLTAEYAKLPPALAMALPAFQPEGPAGWGFVQSTVGPGRTLVEKFTPAAQDPEKWTLVSKDSVAPSAEAQTEYRLHRARAMSGQKAPNIVRQLDLPTMTEVASDERTTTYRFRLRPGDKDDTTAQHMSADFTLDRPTGGIVRLELFAHEAFTPMVSTRVRTARTVVTYLTPATTGAPVLLQEVKMRIEGARLWFKDFDETLTVTYSEHTPPATGGAAPR